MQSFRFLFNGGQMELKEAFRIVGEELAWRVKSKQGTKAALAASREALLREIYDEFYTFMKKQGDTIEARAAWLGVPLVSYKTVEHGLLHKKAHNRKMTPKHENKL